jgi:hypothetical protein
LPTEARKLTAKDLIHQWRDTAHFNSSGRLGADRQIEELAQRFLKEDPVAAYNQNTYRKYDSIYEVATWEEVFHHGAEEVAPCVRGCAKVAGAW